VVNVGNNGYVPDFHASVLRAQRYNFLGGGQYYLYNTLIISILILCELPKKRAVGGSDPEVDFFPIHPVSQAPTNQHEGNGKCQ
jgi:hypothetical protein